jgi:hypothetical protein
MKWSAPIKKLTLLAAPAVAALLAATGQTGAQQPQAQAPVASVSTDARRYPDGSRLREEYATPNQPLPAPATTGATRSAVTGLNAAARAQASLPPDFTLLPGVTKQIPASAPRANAPTAAPGANAAPAPSDEKFVTVHPLAYRGVPLAKGSDYMTVVGGDNRLLVTRKRGLPTAVDGTTPTVAPDAAISAARQAGGQQGAGAGAQQIIRSSSLDLHATRRVAY